MVLDGVGDEGQMWDESKLDVDPTAMAPVAADEAILDEGAVIAAASKGRALVDDRTLGLTHAYVEHLAGDGVDEAQTEAGTLGGGHDSFRGHTGPE